ncbi:MAG TPA: hypothetical protein VJZ27_19840, partial [Aggregatilineales bacterium]|nr:hypothetical protein [Aggregatilineales bacterium]
NSIQFEEQTDLSKLPRSLFRSRLTPEEDLQLMFRLLVESRKDGIAKPPLEYDSEEEPTMTYREFKARLLNNADRRRRKEAWRRRFNSVMRFLGLRKDSD